MAELPALPPMPAAAELQGMDEAALGALTDQLRSVERETAAAMAPFTRHLGEIRARIAEVGTEQRRRERAAHVTRRATVRQAAKAGEMPSLGAALERRLELRDGIRLDALRWFLTSGGEVGLGFATRPGAVSFTDGRRQQLARTWAEALELHAAGWEPGTPGIPGVRVHLSGSRVERVVAATEVVLEPPVEGS